MAGKKTPPVLLLLPLLLIARAYSGDVHVVSIRIRWKSLGGLIEMFGAPDISGGLRWRVSDCDRPPRSLKMTETDGRYLRMGVER